MGHDRYGMIHYHGLPVSGPQTVTVSAVNAGHAFVSFSTPAPLGLAVELCQSFAVDNGAFTSWRAGNPVTDWRPFYKWAEMCRRIPSCDFAVIPDVIDGDEGANDALLDEWPLPLWFGAPVWHMHESLDRLDRLVHQYPRVCIGSSGEYATVGNEAWWKRINQAMGAACSTDGRPLCKLHGLRMLNPNVFTKLPFASADSTNIARNVGIDKSWTKGHYLPPTKEARAQVMRSRIEAHNAPPAYTFQEKS
jgi:hypothetical protein